MTKNNKECTFGPCNRVAKTKGLCGTHYQQSWRGEELRIIKKPGARFCEVEGCNEKHVAKGKCTRHYYNLVCVENNCEEFTVNKTSRCELHQTKLIQKHVTTGSNRVCSEEGCNTRHYAKSYCLRHYRKYCPTKNKKTCTEQGCSSPHIARGYCNKHYAQYKDTFTDVREKTKHHMTDDEYRKAFEFEWTEKQPISDCWIWKKSVRNTYAGGEYGQIMFRSSLTHSHRVSWELFRGPLTKGESIDHLCHMKLCQNPNHFRQVDNTTNIRYTKKAIGDSRIYYFEDLDKYSAFRLGVIEWTYLGLFDTESEAHDAQLELLTRYPIDPKDYYKGDTRECEFEGCERISGKSGLCNTHRAQQLAGKELTPIRIKLGPRPCSEEGCEELARCKGLCEKHYKRMKYYEKKNKKDN